MRTKYMGLRYIDIILQDYIEKQNVTLNQEWECLDSQCNYLCMKNLIYINWAIPASPTSSPSKRSRFLSTAVHTLILFDFF
jgi:hypothetical protein